MQVSLLLRVRFGECDAQNVVFNARYADYVDVGSTEFMRCMCGGYEQLLAQGYDTQVVNLNIDWFSAAHFDEVLRLDVKCIKAGNTSFTLSCGFSAYHDQRKIALATITYVLINTTALSKTQIPAELKRTLLDDSDHGVINFAGALQ